MSGPGWILKRERTRRDWSIEQAVDVLRRAAGRLRVPYDDVDADTVRGWEEGTRPFTIRHLQLLSTAFDVPLPDLMGLSDSGRQAEWLVLAGAPRRTAPDLLLRREFLRYVAALAGASLQEHERLASALGGGSIDGRLLDDLEVLTASYAGQMWTSAPAVLLAMLRGHLGILTRLMPAAAGMPGRRLRLMAGETALVTGRLQWQLQDREAAVGNWMRAEHLAREARDTTLIAHVLGARTEPHSGLNPGADRRSVATAVALLNTALSLAGPPASPYLRVWLLARRAEELAVAGDGGAAERDLAAAETALRETGVRGSGYFSSWDPSGVRLAGYRGSCAVRLGRPRPAIVALEWALAGTSASLASQRAAVLADLGGAYASRRPAEVEHACSLLIEALAIAGSAGLTEKVRRVAAIRARHLAAHGGNRAVRALDERIAASR